MKNIISIIIVTIILVGCGQSGALYMPTNDSESSTNLANDATLE